MTPTLTIFANFYIDTDERYLRMVDSFNSFHTINAAKWVINVRGKHAEKTINFLQAHLTVPLTISTHHSEQGWFYDTRKMLNDIDTDFVFFWVEDHINQVDVKKYDQILADMKQSSSEYLQYSWWFFGKPLLIYKDVITAELSSIYTFTNNKKNLALVEQTHSTYLISMQGIFSTALFKKIITKTSMFLRQFPKQVPFHFEKGADDTKWLPINTAIPKEELFASIDDGIEGYSLQARGLYPERETRPQPAPTIPKSNLGKQARAVIPLALYKKLIRVVIFKNKVVNYINLLRQGK